MRPGLVMSVLCLSLVTVLADEKKDQDTPKRHGVTADLKTFPQDTPKAALASIASAIENKKIDYLLAQLADPEWVDQRLRATGGDFNFLVKETTTKLVDDPAPLKHFQKFIKDGVWEMSDDAASVHGKDVPDRWAYFRKIEGRWFMENRYKPDSGAK
jgi:hypothetical protein